MILHTTEKLMASLAATQSTAGPPVPLPLHVVVPDPPVDCGADAISFYERLSPKYKALWDGDLTLYAGDHSSGDLAMCNIISRTYSDPAKIEAIFNQSALSERDKWRDRPDYRNRTINNAIKSNLNRAQKLLKALTPAEVSERTKEILDSQQPCGPFDINELPDLISRYAKELCSQTAAEPIMIVQSILCTLSSVIGRNVCLPETEYFQRLYPNLWCCTISKSGSFKTTALNKGAVIAYRTQKHIQDQIIILKGPVADSKAAQKETDDKILELEKQSPILSSRATAEAFTEELSTGQGGQIIASEMGAWLKNMNASHAGSIKQLLTDFYDTPAFYSYRTRTGGTLTVREPFITINGVSTIDWIHNNLVADDITSGFFARFLLFYPPQKQIMPAALPSQIKKLPTLEPIINELTAILEKIRSFSAPLEYRLDNKARELFSIYHKSIYTELFNESEKAQQTLEPFVKRWSPYILKLAMIIQVIDDPACKMLTAKSLISSKHVIDYAVKSTTYLFKNDLGETDHQRKCRIILEYIARCGGKRTWGQLLTSHTLDGGSKDYEYPCQTLEESGEIAVDRSSLSKKDHLFAVKSRG